VIVAGQALTRRQHQHAATGFRNAAAAAATSHLAAICRLAAKQHQLAADQAHAAMLTGNAAP